MSQESEKGLHDTILAYLVSKGFTRSVKAFSKEASAGSDGDATKLVALWNASVAVEQSADSSDSDSDSSDDESDADSSSSEEVAKPGIGSKAKVITKASGVTKVAPKKKLDEVSDSGSDSDSSESSSASSKSSFSASSSSSSASSPSAKSAKSSSASSSSSASTKVSTPSPKPKPKNVAKVTIKSKAVPESLPLSASTTLDDEESDRSDIQPLGGFLDVEAEVSDDDEVSSDEEEDSEDEYESDEASDKDSEGSEDSSSESEEPVKPVKKGKESKSTLGQKRKAPSPSPFVSSSESSSSSASSASSSSGSGTSAALSIASAASPPPQSSKKRKLSKGKTVETKTETVPGTATTESGEIPVAVTTTTTTTVTPAENGADAKVTETVDVVVKDEKGKKVNKRFERIKSENVTYHHDGLKDNTFESRIKTGASENDYGAKASRDLIVTRGAGFRKEKNKKKRGSYAGGEITMQSHSIKFDD